MVLFWLIVIIGGLFAFLGLKKGVYTMYTVVFNLGIAIYVSVLSTPLVVSTTPNLEMGYYAAFSLSLMTLFLFALLQGFAWYFFLRGSDVLFPDLFDKIGGAALGFVTGYAVLAVLALTYCMMPISRQDTMKGFLPVSSLDQFSSNTMNKLCNTAAFWSLECLDGAAEETTEYLISLSHPKDERPTVPATPETPETMPAPIAPGPDGVETTISSDPVL